MDDLSTYALLISSATFVFLSFALLFRYRQVSKQITASNDLGRDLWAALEARLKKQDERIIDMMGRVEVIQSRALDRQSFERPSGPEPMPDTVPPVMNQESVGESEPSLESHHVMPQAVSQPETPHVTADAELARDVGSRLMKQDERLLDMLRRLETIQSHLTGGENSPEFAGAVQSPRSVSRIRDSADKVSETILIQMLGERPRTSVEIRERFGITREHAARVLKGFFDRKLVTRNDAHKPFVYELTEAGRSMLMGDGQLPSPAPGSEENGQTAG